MVPCQPILSSSQQKRGAPVEDLLSDLFISSLMALRVSSHGYSGINRPPFNQSYSMRSTGVKCMSARGI